MKVPWLLVHGTADDVVPIEESRELFEQANDPKELFVIENCDHVFDAETDPDALPAMVGKVSNWLMPEVKRRTDIRFPFKFANSLRLKTANSSIFKK